MKRYAQPMPPQAEGLPRKRGKPRPKNLTKRAPNEAQTGRRHLLADPKKREEILGGLSTGMAIREACLAAGITERVFYLWQQQAVADVAAGNLDTLEVQFFQELDQASCRGERRLAVLWADHAKRDYRAARDLLTMSPRWRDRWGKREKLEMSGPGGGPIPLSVELPERKPPLPWDGAADQ